MLEGGGGGKVWEATEEAPPQLVTGIGGRRWESAEASGKVRGSGVVDWHALDPGWRKKDPAAAATAQAG